MTSDRRSFRNAIVPTFRRHLIASAIAALALAPVPTLAAIDMFLRLQGIEGESKDARHPNHIDVLSYSFGVGLLPEAGPIANKPCGSLDVVKNLDKASPRLMQAAMTGAHIPTGVLAFSRTTGDQQEFYRIELTNIAVGMVAQSGATGGAIPVEAVALRAATYKVTYKAQKLDGSLDGAVVFGWNCLTNHPA